MFSIFMFSKIVLFLIIYISLGMKGKQIWGIKEFLSWMMLILKLIGYVLRSLGFLWSQVLYLFRIRIWYFSKLRVVRLKLGFNWLKSRNLRNVMGGLWLNLIFLLVWGVVGSISLKMDVLLVSLRCLVWGRIGLFSCCRFRGN